MRTTRLLTGTRQTLLLAALLCVLLARVMVPAGWMPMPGKDGGIVLAPCSGMGAVRMPEHLSGGDMAGMDMSSAHADPSHHAAAAGKDEPRHTDTAGDHPCSGAGVSVALVLPPFDLKPAPRGHAFVAVRPQAGAAIGRGLAAPPPPSTGPPALG